MLREKDKLITDLKAAVAEFQNKETLRIEESITTQRNAEDEVLPIPDEVERLRADLAQTTKAHEEVLQEIALVRSQNINLHDCNNGLTVDKEELESENKALKVDVEHLRAAIVKYEQHLIDKHKLIANLEAAIAQFQTRETSRMEETMATQNLLKQQSNLIQSL